MLEKYLLLHRIQVKQPRSPTYKKEIVAPMTLSDDRKQISTMEEEMKLKSIVLVHNLSDYRRRVTNELLPEIHIAIDILIDKGENINELLSVNRNE